MTSPTESAATFAFANASLIAIPPKSLAVNELSAPPNLPNGVRTPSKITVLANPYTPLFE